MYKIFTIASVAAAIALVPSAHATQFVTNGNFSALTHGLGEIDNNTVATGWTSAGYNFVMNKADVGSSGSYGGLSLWDKANGGANTWDGYSPTHDNFVAMDGDFGINTQPVEQTITGLTAGKTYDLSFSYAFAQQAGFTGDTIQSLSESFGSSPIFTSATVNLPSKGFSGWKTYTGTVTADGTSDVLAFLAHGNLPIPPFALFTDVSLTGSVPEPATWAMMIVGMGAVGAFARRRRQVLATA